MPKNRKAPAPNPETPNHTQGENKMSAFFSPIDDAELTEVKENSRGSGTYDQTISGFLASELNAVKFNRSGEKPTTNSIKTGLKSAVERATKKDADHPAKNVEIRVYNDQVYLVRTDLA